MTLIVPQLALVLSLLTPPATPPATGTCGVEGLSEPARRPGVPFDELAQGAVSALEAGRVSEAVRFYRAAVDLNPLWEEGWFRLAVTLVDAGCPEPARDAARRAVRLSPQAGPGWGVLGLAEFALARYETAATSLSRAMGLGMASAPEIGRRVLHHRLLLSIRDGDYAAAGKALPLLARLEPDDPGLVAACGLAALRLPRLPSELSPAEAEVVQATGRAAYALLVGRGEEGHKAFEDAIARFPRARGVHFAYGLVLSREGSPQALRLLRREAELFPDHGDAQLELAFELLERGPPAEALAPAQAAARLLPDSFWSQLALGRAQLVAGAADEAIAALERAAVLAPHARDIYVSLAQAYARAGRAADVQRARQRLQELDASQQPSR